jgi:hypothetical protein
MLKCTWGCRAKLRVGGRVNFLIKTYYLGANDEVFDVFGDTRLTDIRRITRGRGPSEGVRKSWGRTVPGWVTAQEILSQAPIGQLSLSAL